MQTAFQIYFTHLWDPDGNSRLRGIVSNGNEEVLYTLQNWSLATKCSFMSYTGPLLGFLLFCWGYSQCILNSGNKVKPITRKGFSYLAFDNSQGNFFCPSWKDKKDIWLQLKGSFNRVERICTSLYKSASKQSCRRGFEYIDYMLWIGVRTP